MLSVVPTSDSVPLLPIEQVQQETEARAAEKKQKAIARSLALPPDPKNIARAQKAAFTKKVQRWLASRKGDVIKEYGMSRGEAVLSCLADTATNPRSPQQVAAAALLLSYAYGKPRPSEEEVDALREGGFRLVYIDRPQLEVQETKELPAPRPEFLDAEVVE